VAARSIHMNAFGTFAYTRRWEAETPRTLLVQRGQVPVRDGRVCFAQAAPDGANGIEAVTFATRAQAMSADGITEEAMQAALGGEVSWTAPRSLLQMVQLLPETEDEVTAVCSAVSLLQWHIENKFSSVDGSPTVIADGGKKRLRGGSSLHPRVDPVAIVLCVSADGMKCLLGRQKRFPPGMYTCISGFVEHAESVEAAAAREVAEETSVVCADVRLVGSQPWPIGRGGHCELMLGCTARATPGGEAIDCTGDGQEGTGELEDARWFSRAEVVAMLEASTKPPSRGADGVVPQLRTPPPIAIAHHLVRRWAHATQPEATSSL
tara:strand:+ start:1131 stop:2096 length:966 start_codon:yes stop_codon:yes gene_type:complete